MAALKLKLCDLNGGDVGSIKSMFHLTAAQRKQEWEIVSSGDADLCVYSFESEKSIAAWQKHSYLDGMSVLFSTNEDVDVAMDMVLKKPLRTKNFVEVLNKAAKQIKLAATIEKSASKEDEQPTEPAPVNTKTNLTDTTTTKQKQTEKPAIATEQNKATTPTKKPSGDNNKSATPSTTDKETSLEDIYAAEQEQAATPGNSSEQELTLEEIYASEQESVQKESFLSSVSSSLSKHLTLKKSAHRSLPELSLLLPEQSTIQPDLILEPSVLSANLNQLIRDNNDDALISTILDNLIPLNRFVIPAKTRQNILEIYRKASFHLMRSWEAKLQQLEQLSHIQYLESAHALASLIDELAIGYKILLMEAYENGSHPKSKEPFLLAISRVAEYSSLYILHSYSFLRTNPTEKLQTLHQLYLCCEAAKVLDIKVSSKDDQASLAFSTIYNQIILTSIADPLRLSKVDILKLYRLMAKYTTKIKITSLTKEQKQFDDDIVVVGHFVIDTTSNNIPVSLEVTSTATRNLPQTRLFNTHAVLTAIETIFQQAANSIENDVYSSEILLLKKVTPHLNTSYERQYERFPFKENVEVNLVKDIADIQQTLQSGNLKASNNWNIHNRGLGGMMVSIKTANTHRLDVGDFYGVFGAEDSPLLALVRWLRIDNDEDVTMGLELHRGHPTAVSCTVENDTEQLSLLILRDEKEAATLMAEKDLITVDQALQVTEDDTSYIVSIDTLIDNSFNYDHFGFTVI